MTGSLSTSRRGPTARQSPSQAGQASCSMGAAWLRFQSQHRAQGGSRCSGLSSLHTSPACLKLLGETPRALKPQLGVGEAGGRD